MLLDIRDEIPCATEQGINSRQTGNLIRPNRELIRDNRELGTGTEKWLKIDPLARGSACFAPSPKPRGRASRKSRANVRPHSRRRRGQAGGDMRLGGREGDPTTGFVLGKGRR